MTSGLQTNALHMTAGALERFTTGGIRTILDFMPSVVTYSNHHSVRRNHVEIAVHPRSETFSEGVIRGIGASEDLTEESELGSLC